MMSSTFYEYVVHPRLLDNVQFSIILFLDRHKSRLSIELTDYCSEKKIHVYCLPPNAMHIIQTCKVANFKPLKTYWKSEWRKYKTVNPNVPITKSNFTRLFRKAFDKYSGEVITKQTWTSK